MPECLEKCIFAARVLLCGGMPRAFSASSALYFQHCLTQASDVRECNQKFLGHHRERERESGTDSIFEVRKQDRCLRYSFLLRMFQDDLINLDSSIPNRCNIAAAVSKRHTL